MYASENLSTVATSLLKSDDNLEFFITETLPILMELLDSATRLAWMIRTLLSRSPVSSHVNLKTTLLQLSDLPLSKHVSHTCLTLSSNTRVFHKKLVHWLLHISTSPTLVRYFPRSTSRLWKERPEHLINYSHPHFRLHRRTPDHGQCNLPLCEPFHLSSALITTPTPHPSFFALPSQCPLMDFALLTSDFYCSSTSQPSRSALCPSISHLVVLPVHVSCH